MSVLIVALLLFGFFIYKNRAGKQKQRLQSKLGTKDQQLQGALELNRVLQDKVNFYESANRRDLQLQRFAEMVRQTQDPFNNLPRRQG